MIYFYKYAGVSFEKLVGITENALKEEQRLGKAVIGQNELFQAAHRTLRGSTLNRLKDVASKSGHDFEQVLQKASNNSKIPSNFKVTDAANYSRNEINIAKKMLGIPVPKDMPIAQSKGSKLKKYLKIGGGLAATGGIGYLAGRQKGAQDAANAIYNELQRGGMNNA